MILKTLTRFENGSVQTNLSEHKFFEDTVGIENELVNIYTDVEWQKITGFGGLLPKHQLIIFHE